MTCPECRAELKMADRLGVEIDYCPQCRGVWLDRGELDKIIERSAAPPPMYDGERRGHDRDDAHRYERHEDDRYAHPGRRKKGFLGGLFNFD